MAQSLGKAVGLAGNVAGAVGGIDKFFQGNKMRRTAQKHIDNFRWQTLQNPYDNQSVSTLGADLRKEQADLNTASSIDALRSGGARTMLAGIGRVQAQNNLVSRDIAANLDTQQKALDYAAAQQDVANQQVMENRQANELAGYGQMLNVGMGMKYQGLGDIQSTATSLGNPITNLFGTKGTSNNFNQPYGW